MSDFYLEHEYLSLSLSAEPGEGSGQFGYVGPFDSEQHALNHRALFGPVEAKVVTERKGPIEMSPEEHRAYTWERL